MERVNQFAELEGQTSTSSHNGVMCIRFTAPPLTTRKIKIYGRMIFIFHHHQILHNRQKRTVITGRTPATAQA